MQRFSRRAPEDCLPLKFVSAFIHRVLLFSLGIVLAAAPFAHAQQSTASPESAPAKSAAFAQGKGDSEATQLLRQQGRADSAILDWVLAHSGPIHADVHAGELRVAFTISPAEGWWDKAGDGKLAWHDAPAGNVHLRIFVADSAGRLVPDLSLRATLVDAFGNEQSVPVDFGWYPLVNAYGGNVPIDTDGSYTLRVTIDPQSAPVGHLSARTLPRVVTAVFAAVTVVRSELAPLPPATALAYANEADLLKPCNAALGATITYLWQHSLAGSDKAAGDYFVGYALDSPLLSSTASGGKLRLLEPHGGEMELAVFPRDSRTGRVMPALKLQAVLIAADKTEHGPGDLPLIWHPWFNHYGHSVHLPRSGSYRLRVHIDAPGYRRWGRQSERFAAPADLEFDDVLLKEEKH